MIPENAASPVSTNPQTAAKKQTGRPSKYDPSMNDRVVALGRLGFSKAQIASDLDISTDTMDRWCRDNPAFAGSMALARTHALAVWEGMAMAGVNDRNFNALAYKVAMAGRFHAEYRESQNPAVSVTVNTVPAGLDLASLDASERHQLRAMLDKMRAGNALENAQTIEHSPSKRRNTAIPEG